MPASFLSLQGEIRNRIYVLAVDNYNEESYYRGGMIRPYHYVDGCMSCNVNGYPAHAYNNIFKQMPTPIRNLGYANEQVGNELRFFCYQSLCHSALIDFARGTPKMELDKFWPLEADVPIHERIPSGSIKHVIVHVQNVTFQPYPKTLNKKCITINFRVRFYHSDSAPYHYTVESTCPNFALSFGQRVGEMAKNVERFISGRMNTVLSTLVAENRVRKEGVEPGQANYFTVGDWGKVLASLVSVVEEASKDLSRQANTRRTTAGRG